MYCSTCFLYFHGKTPKKGHKFMNINLFSDLEDDGRAHCLLHVFIDSCHGLESPATKSKESSKPSPKVELFIGSEKESQSTWPQYYTNDPVFEQGFVFTVTNPYSDDLHLRVIDTGHKDTEIANLKIRTSGRYIIPTNVRRSFFPENNLLTFFFIFFLKLQLHALISKNFSFAKIAFHPICFYSFALIFTFVVNRC